MDAEQISKGEAEAETEATAEAAAKTECGNPDVTSDKPEKGI